MLKKLMNYRFLKYKTFNKTAEGKFKSRHLKRFSFP